MTPFSRLQLDTEHLNNRSRSVPEGQPERVRTGKQQESETSSLLRSDSPPFADVPLADTPRITSLSSITRTSASNTPRPIQPPSIPQRTPSPAPKAKPPLIPQSGHRRQPSDVSASALPEVITDIKAESDRAFSNSGELPERLSWNSEDVGQANGLDSSKEWRDGTTLGAKSLESVQLPGDEVPQSMEKGKRQRFCSWMAKDPLLSLTLLGVVVGVAAGLALRPVKLSPDAIEVLGFPGEVMLRLLKMLVLPLVAGSMVAGVCALRGSAASMARVARYTLLYYAVTTVTAVILGIVLVNIIWPGKGQPLGNGDVSTCHEDLATDVIEETILTAPVSPLTALLGVARNIFPDNIAIAAVDMNILGIITFSLFFGLALATLGDAADPFVHGIDVFNKCISKMVGVVLWISPIGIASLIAASIVGACDLLQTLLALGLWVLTVLVGLVLFAAIILPALLWVVTRMNPLKFLRTFSQALVLAFGTSSSSAALPVAMECATAAGCDANIIKFVLPLGTTVNMNGTALYEATTVIFIAQAHGVSLGLAGTVVVACTATLAAIGAAAIPSAGLVTMLMVLQAVSLERFAADLAVILAIDWLLDRCRTAVNLMSDAMAVVIVDHLCREQQQQSYSQIEMA